MAAATGDRVFPGHPAGLSILFATEIGERFSYYGMRALLILYLTQQLGLSDAAAGGIYGDYTGLVYLAPLFGGWLADRYLGLQRSITAGGVLMVAGHSALVLHAWPRPGAPPPGLGLVWLGLFLIVAGSGLFKPNMLTLLGRLYAPGDARRDAGFTLFYMAINLGALAPFVAGYLGQRRGWHLGFLCAALGALVATAVFAWFRHRLGEHGREPLAHAAPVREGPCQPVADPPPTRAPLGTWRRVLLILAALPGLLLGAHLALRAAAASGSLLEAFRAALWPVVFSISVSVYAFLQSRCDAPERRRVNVIFLLSLFVILFWAAVEQTGSTLTLFAERYTQRRVGGFEIPSSFIQGLTPVWILLLAPLFTWLWTRLAARGREPSAPAKMAGGLFLQVAAYGVMSVATLGGLDGRRISPVWLIAFFALQTCGELALSPMGLSMVTRVAPRRFASLLMGVWMLSASWANKLAGASAGLLEPLGPSRLFPVVAVVLALVGLALVALLPWIRRQLADERGAAAASSPATSAGAPA